MKSAKSGVALIGVLGMVPLLLVSGCSQEVERPLNLVLITIDTLRPDRLGYTGHERATSPVIDGLAREGVVFENNYSVSGWTLPSVVSLLTGRYPRDHGATDFHLSKAKSVSTLAEIMTARGYDSRGFVSHVLLRPHYGVAEGFGAFDYSVLNRGNPHDVATARPLTDLALEALDEMRTPFFLWVHYFDPHFEYLLHEEWAEFGELELDRYDQEIAHTDAEIGRLIAKLKQLEAYDQTVIALTADHGEEFGEHGGKWHFTLMDEVMRVPLILRAPSMEPRRIETITEQIDLLPTVLGLLQIDVDKELDLPGRDILSAPFAGGADPRPIYIERDRPPPYKQRGVIFGGHKLIFIELADVSKIPKRSLGTQGSVDNVRTGVFLYDLVNDPQEENNIYVKDHPKAKELFGLLANHFSKGEVVGDSVDVDEALRDKLRSLGYIR